MDVIIVTGANSGIGLSTATVLRDAGYQVVATARAAEDLERLQQHGFLVHSLELRDPSSISSFCRWLDDREYEVKVLVNNAGILYLGPVLALPEDQWSDLVQVNVLGPLRLIRGLLGNLRRNRGRIINISSDQGLVTLPHTTLYSMSKYALEALTDGLAEELKDLGIGVHAIEPGNIASEIMNKAGTQLPSIGEVPESVQDLYEELLPQLLEAVDEFSESAAPEQVAKAVLHCIQSSNPLRRYLVTRPSETLYVINELFDRIAMLNQGSNHPLDEKSLIEKLQFSLNLYH